MPIARGSLGTGGAAAAVVAGVLVAALAAALALLVLLLTGYGCEGTDVSSPPAQGSKEAGLCGWPTDFGYAALLPLSVIAPLVGGAWAAVTRSLRPLALGCAASAAALLLPAAFADRLASASGLLLLPTLAVLVAALVVARRAQ
jgi:hypothetical protein